MLSVVHVARALASQLTFSRLFKDVFVFFSVSNVFRSEKSSRKFSRAGRGSADSTNYATTILPIIFGGVVLSVN